MILESGSNFKLLDIRQIATFLRRYSFFKVQKAKSVDKAQLYYATEEEIRPWFNLFKVLEIKAILLENYYNKDEASIIKSYSTNRLIIRTSNYKALIKKEPRVRT